MSAWAVAFVVLAWTFVVFGLASNRIIFRLVRERDAARSERDRAYAAVCANDIERLLEGAPSIGESMDKANTYGGIDPDTLQPLWWRGSFYVREPGANGGDDAARG